MKKPFVIIGGLVALGVIGVAALVVVFVLRSDDANLKTEAPAIPTASSGTPAASSTASSSDASLPAGTLHFVIDATAGVPLEVKYVVKETLRGIADSQAVGTTNAITGDLYLTPAGLAAGVQSKFVVDLTKLKTDESQRDNYVRQNVLQTGRFPNAEFVVESISPFPANYVEGTEVSLTMSGTLTLHGVSKKVDWAVKARRQGKALTGIADLSFNMSDFGIQPPEVPIAKAQDGVKLQMTIAATQKN
ncbi:MAG TPA: YceI family protein [Dehalococcoidia bacterium]|nr:YceI family protein [Dehalococcoidia bacterium]